MRLFTWIETASLLSPTVLQDPESNSQVSLSF